MGKTKEEAWYEVYNRKVLAYKIYKVSLNVICVLSAITFFVLSAVMHSKFYMALSFGSMLIYNIISFFNLKFDYRFEFDDYDKLWVSYGFAFTAMGVLIMLEILPFLQYVFGFVIMLFIFILTSISGDYIEDVDLLSWDKIESFVDALICFGIIMITLFYYPVKDTLRSLNYSIEAECKIKAKNEYLKSITNGKKYRLNKKTNETINLNKSEKENEKSIDKTIIKQNEAQKGDKENNTQKEVSLSPPSEEPPKKKKVSRPKKEIMEDFLDEDVNSSEMSSREIVKPHREDND